MGVAGEGELVGQAVKAGEHFVPFLHLAQQDARVADNLVDSSLARNKESIFGI